MKHATAMKALQDLYKWIECAEHDMNEYELALSPREARNRFLSAKTACLQAKAICARLVGEDWHKTKETE